MNPLSWTTPRIGVARHRHFIKRQATEKLTCPFRPRRDASRIRSASVPPLPYKCNSAFGTCLLTWNSFYRDTNPWCHGSFRENIMTNFPSFPGAVRSKPCLIPGNFLPRSPAPGIDGKFALYFPKLPVHQVIGYRDRSYFQLKDKVPNASCICTEAAATTEADVSIHWLTPLGLKTDRSNFSVACRLIKCRVSSPTPIWSSPKRADSLAIPGLQYKDNGFMSRGVRWCGIAHQD